MVECKKCSWHKWFVKRFKTEQKEKIFKVTVLDVIYNKIFTRLVAAYDKIEAIQKTKNELRWEYEYSIQRVEEVEDCK